MTATLFTTSLLMGLTGSLHCAGMCGPIVILMPFGHMDHVKRVFAMYLYHAGRISTYATMGILMFALKATIHPEWQQYFSIFSGVILLIIGLMSFTGSLSLKLPWTKFVQKTWSELLSHPGLFTFFIAGILNGLLPCGLVYMALSISVTVTAWTDAAMQMAVFGLGTVPMLLIITVLGKKITMFRRRSIQRMIPVTIIALSGLLMLRGMNLGIPYLSPRISVDETIIKTSCCNKPQ